VRKVISINKSWSAASAFFRSLITFRPLEIVYGRKARQFGELGKLEGSMVADAA
jgi:hypothetical protein